MKKVLVIAVCTIAISAVSSCAKCASCRNPSRTDKIKICNKDDKDRIDDMIDSYEASGWKCTTSSETI